jgi:hypothetical protein
LPYTPVVDVCGTFTLRAGKFREGMPFWGRDATVKPAQVQGGHVKVLRWRYFDPARRSSRPRFKVAM